MEIDSGTATIIPVPDDQTGDPSMWLETSGPVPDDKDNSYLTRHWFPKGFIFGTGTSAYQVEGASAEGGKGISIWDEFSKRNPGKIADGSNGVVACDMYHRYKEDIRRMKQMGLDSYRFSISWPRILPGGRCSAGINREGIEYYNDVINTVLAHDMIPFVTLFHWDLPDCLEKEYGGFLSKTVKDDFKEFAEVCFWEFGDRVKYWSTINEPYTYSVLGYVMGIYPPGRKIAAPEAVLARKLPASASTFAPQKTKTPSDEDEDEIFARGDPADAYTVSRNMLLAHAEAAHLYRTKFQEFQKGKIGISLNCNWFEPYNENSEEDKATAIRAVEFMLGWYLHPIMYGSYPESMINNVPADNLASFTPHEREMLKGSIDFLGLNYYTSEYASYDPQPQRQAGYFADIKANFTSERDGKYIGKPSGSHWLFVVPRGIYYLLDYIRKNYTTLDEIHITENGVSTTTDHKQTAIEVCKDYDLRAKYFQDHLANILKVMRDKNMKNIVKGYFTWTWCDNFEWSGGYTVRFGLVCIDFENNLTRYPKDSMAWFAKFLKSDSSPPLSLQRQLFGKRSIEENEENVTDKRLKVVENDQYQ